MRRGRGRRQEPETAGLAPIPFSPNVGLAAVITACQPSEGLPTEHLPQRTAGGGCGGEEGRGGGRNGDLGGAWRHGCPPEPGGHAALAVRVRMRGRTWWELPRAVA